MKYEKMTTSDVTVNHLEITKIQGEVRQTSQGDSDVTPSISVNEASCQSNGNVNVSGFKAGLVQAHQMTPDAADVRGVLNGHVAAASAPAEAEPVTSISNPSQTLAASTYTAQPAVKPSPAASVVNSAPAQKSAIAPGQVTLNIINPSAAVQAPLSSTASKMALGASQLVMSSPAVISTKIIQGSSAVAGISSQPVFTVSPPSQARVTISLAPAPRPGVPAVTSGAPAPRPGVPAVTSGAPAPRPGVPAVTSGAPVPRPGVPAVTSGAPRPGVPVVTSGAPRPGVPAVTSGVPAPRPGLPAVTSGAPAPRPGLPAVTSGAPAPRPGLPAVTSGAPAPRPGLPAVTSGAPAPHPGLQAVTSGAPAPRPGLPAVTSGTPASKVSRLVTFTQTPGKGAAATPKANGAPWTPQTTTVQLPANFQIPQGMVLIRSDGGQLMLVSQQALAQAQAQGLGLPRTAASTSSTTARAPATQTTVTAIIRKPETTSVAKAQPQHSGAAVTSLQRIPLVKSTGGTAAAVTSVQAIRPTAPTPPAPPAVPATTPFTAELSKPTPAAQSTFSAETLENVKKCKNFLVTLIKLSSSGARSAEMAQNVKELVKDLLDGKIEPEEFTERLYTELKSSPQGYLVPFLKRSVPALRQLTPSSQLFIQQCEQQKPEAASVTPPAAAVKPAPATPAKPAPLVLQQTRGVVIKQPFATVQPQSAALLQTRVLQKPPLTAAFQTSLQQTGTVVKQALFHKPNIINVQTSLVQKTSFKENSSATFRDEDDINDVASMAGVNLSEENARILATNSELVGSIIRSCRDEPFLLTAILQKRILETGGFYSCLCKECPGWGQHTGDLVEEQSCSDIKPFTPLPLLCWTKSPESNLQY
ncbi:transcription initiation factor TFIID subunit 4 isoform X2 [Lepisosteus oculatus]|uniref:transcription initiation factor TFIID subunit 4 isoform X2 n=1 Tax=Lepisosteus oculatus TaxID=7918 RepID=UPI003711A511